MGSNISLATLLPPLSILLSRFNNRQRYDKEFEQALLDMETDSFSFGFDHLPDNIILQIVSYLNSQDCVKASMLCKKWYNVCQDRSLWNKMDFSSKSAISSNVKLKDKDIICLIIRLPVAVVSAIDFSGHCCRSLTNFTLFHIARRCHLLHTLNLSNCKLVTDTGLEIITKNCPFIENLDISSCSAITDEGAIFTARTLRVLKTLNVSGNSWISNLPFFYFARHARRLVNLSFEGCKKVTNVGLQILTKSKTIKHINLRNTVRISSSGLKVFLAKSPSLEGLKLGFGKRSMASIDILNVIPRYCKNLVLLDVQNYKCRNIDENIREIARMNPRLRYLCVRQKLTRLSTETIQNLEKLCPNLSKIEQT
ncbi:F-box/LRR-repeat protein 17-like [Actinia tenebrosa]|uniref:F-box/LRR-repeat protein 17-like n=1 Tax=Actinia tenebrosa TaxID=6105 RepID=A0A6P8HCR7_ACTTE|nr:F-box/LRR-repeat protein 17-like [Actinia tenebrosa]